MYIIHNYNQGNTGLTPGGNISPCRKTHSLSKLRVGKISS